jgi:hypothetical protein
MEISREAGLAQGGARDIVSGFADAALKYGLLLQRGSADRNVKPMDALPSADADAFTATPLATAASPQVFSGADFDGVVGAGIVPGYSQRAVFALSSHADFDATTMTVCYETQDGSEAIDNLAVPDGGNTSLYTTRPVSVLKWVALPAQSGTGGTITIGQDPTALYLGLDPRVFVGVGSYDPATESYAATTEVAENHEVDVLRRGRLYVVVEAAVADGDPAYVRVVASGSDVRGQFRGSYAANFVRLPHAHFVSTQGTADGLAVLQLGGVS